jgi:hypothetical protein
VHPAYDEYGRRLDARALPDVSIADDFGIADAEFIAHAREDVPALLAEVERLRTANDAGAAENGRLQLDNARLTAAIHAATVLYRDSLAIQPETLAGRCTTRSPRWTATHER